MRWKPPAFTRNFYVSVLSVFFIWMLVSDANDMVSQFKLWRQVEKLDDEKQFYRQAIEKVKSERKEVMGNPQLLEKFARERYLMKKKTEDVFVIVDERGK